MASDNEEDIKVENKEEEINVDKLFEESSDDEENEEVDKDKLFGSSDEEDDNADKDEAEVEDQETRTRRTADKQEDVVINLELPKIKPVRKNPDEKIYFVKVPNFLHVEPKPFSKDTYEIENLEDANEKVKLKVENTIRWKFLPGFELVHNCYARRGK
jgi:RNA polymerase-associated protein LEO1